MMPQEWLPAIPTNMARKATSRNPEREVMVRVEPGIGTRGPVRPEPSVGAGCRGHGEGVEPE